MADKHEIQIGEYIYHWILCVAWAINDIINSIGIPTMIPLTREVKIAFNGLLVAWKYNIPEIDKENKISCDMVMFKIITDSW